MREKAKGLLTLVEGWMGKITALTYFIPLIEVLIRMVETKGTIKIGPEKKKAVLDSLNKALEIYGVPGWIRFAVKLIAPWLIDLIVMLKNKSGEFTHTDG